jgi:ATP-dependent Clp protease ATP-binding subunit ClpB
LKAAIDELRKGKVTSASAEKHNSLNKYAKNLNELAKDGKLDQLLAVMKKSDVYCKY